MMDISSQWLASRSRSTDDRSSTLRPHTRSMDATTARSSLDHYASPKDNLSRLSHLKQGPPPSRSLTALSTPHDQILEKMYKHAGRSESTLPLPSKPDDSPMPPNPDGTPRGNAYHMGSVEATRSLSLNEPANFRDRAVSATPTASFASNSFPATKLYDPFDGLPLGTISPIEASEQGGEDMAANTGGSSSEELWLHLSRVLDLQNQIARMHMDMEGVGLGKASDGKGKGTIGNASRTGSFHRPRTTSTGSVPGGDIGDEEGVGVVDEEAEKLKAREREFKKLATQFEGRKVAINEMMGKLDDLSQALTEFHSLQAPKIEFPGSSRNSSLNANTSEQFHLPTIIPPSDYDAASPVTPRNSNPWSSNMAPHLPTTPNLERATHKERSNSSIPASNTLPLPKSLGRRGQVPALIIDSIEPGSQPHVIDSPASTVSLRLPHEENAA